MASLFREFWLKTKMRTRDGISKQREFLY